MRTYFGILAVVFIAGAVWLFLRRLAVATGGATASGRIVAFETREDDGSALYLPIVSFADRQGRSHRFTSLAGGTKQSPPVGSSVTVRYLPSSPEQAFIASLLHMWAAPLAFFVLGIGAMIAYFKW